MPAGVMVFGDAQPIRADRLVSILLLLQAHGRMPARVLADIPDDSRNGSQPRQTRSTPNTGLAASAGRYYEQLGLLPAPGRTASG